MESNAIIIIDPEIVPSTFPLCLAVPNHRVEVNRLRSKDKKWRVSTSRNGGYRFGWVVKEIKNEELKARKLKTRLAHLVMAVARFDRGAARRALVKNGGESFVKVPVENYASLEIDLNKLLSGGQ